MRLYLARHTETNFNLLKLCNADPSVDVHLSDDGIKQAKHLRHALVDADFEIIYISELPRTKETADYINKNHHKPVVVDKRLNDNKTGFESQPVQEWLNALDKTDDRWKASFNDGESLQSAYARVQEFISELKYQPYKSVLVITHGFITQAIYGIINDLPVEQIYDYQLTQGEYDLLEV